VARESKLHEGRTVGRFDIDPIDPAPEEKDKFGRAHSSAIEHLLREPMRQP
jgi:hypothetical protein